MPAPIQRQDHYVYFYLFMNKVLFTLKKKCYVKKNVHPIICTIIDCHAVYAS